MKLQNVFCLIFIAALVGSSAMPHDCHSIDCQHVREAIRKGGKFTLAKLNDVRLIGMGSRGGGFYVNVQECDGSKFQCTESCNYKSSNSTFICELM